MADINVERKQGPGIWPWIIGIIILLLIIWWLFARGRHERAEEITGKETTSVAAPPAPGAMGGAAAGAAAGGMGAMGTMPSDTGMMAAAGGAQGIPVAQILANPSQYNGQSVTGTDSVTEVVSNRGFWIEDHGKRLFVAMAEPQPSEQVLHVNPGQKVHLTGMVHRGGANMNVPFKLEPKAQQVASKEPAFLTAQYRDVSVTS